MRILIVLTYFTPYRSGLTVYAERQARALVKLGHEVTVLTSQNKPGLPLEEQDHGVNILRVPVAFHLSKGVVMPMLPFKAWHLIKRADIVNLHVPQFDAAMIALLAKLQKKPVVMTYHCDLSMPAGWINRLAGWAARQAHRVAASLADVIVHNTRDFAEHSDFLQMYLDKVEVIPPPVVVEDISQDDVLNFRQKYKIEHGQRIIGMVARLATEKGVEVLVQALPEIIKELPDVRVVFVGEYLNVIGEDAYRDRLLPLIHDLGEHWTFLGLLSEKEKTAFFHVCDVLALPSINSTESFGMVQVEAMMCGTPAISTNLPGVRIPVQSTGMGRVVPVKDPQALAKAIIQALKENEGNGTDIDEKLLKIYGPQSVAKAYEDIYAALLEENGSPTS
jgi:glycosyltransferase involved in cell wall biosynthesis